MNHSKAVICDLPYNESISVVVKCGTGPGVYAGPIGKTLTRTPTQNPSLTELQATAIKIASVDYTDYTKVFLSPSVSLMIETGLWIELEAAIGFIVGLGLASLMGQRTVPVILMIVLEIVLTPIFSRAEIPHLVNLQRGLVGLAMDHLAPSARSIWGRRWTGRPGWIGAPLRVDHSGGLRHRGLARGMDCPRHVADGAQRRLIRSLGDPQHHHHHRVQVIDASHGSRFAPSPRTGLPAP